MKASDVEFLDLDFGLELKAYRLQLGAKRIDFPSNWFFFPSIQDGRVVICRADDFDRDKRLFFKVLENILPVKVLAICFFSTSKTRLSMGLVEERHLPLLDKFDSDQEDKDSGFGVAI